MYACLSVCCRFTLFLCLVVLGLGQSVIINHNVAFQKVKEVTTTRSRWLVTFMIDLRPYAKIIGKLEADIRNVSEGTQQVANYYFADNNQYMKSFQRLAETVNTVRGTYDGIIASFTEYSTLYQRRSKRSMLPFVGKALHFLFGTVTDSDMDAVRRSVKILTENQRDMAHVVEESLSIINVSRVQISENRQTINAILEGLIDMGDQIQALSEELERKVHQLEAYVSSYFQIDLVVNEAQQMINRMSNYLEHLQLQLNMLSLGRLAPSTITPNNLKALLLDIESHLEPHLKLPADPQKELWTFYQFLTCSTILQNNMILVLVPIPLLDFSYEFEVYRVHNLPVPFTQTNSKESTPMTAQYDLESEALVVNVQRTRFAFITEEELEGCSKPLLSFCAIRNPVYPLNVNRFCVTALFMNKTSEIEEFCQTRVKLSSMLPVARYVTDGLWLLSLNIPMRFSINCPSQPLRSIQVHPPIGTLKLAKSCTATADEMTLTPYYQRESEFQVNYTLVYKQIRLTDLKLWQPFHSALPNFTKIQFPRKLKGIKDIPMQHLINTIRDLQNPDEKKGRSIWFYFAIGSVILVILAVTGLVVYLVLLRKYSIAQWSNPLTRLWKRTMEVTIPDSVAEDSAGVTNTNREVASAPMIQVHYEADKADKGGVRLYPSIGQ